MSDKVVLSNILDNMSERDLVMVWNYYCEENNLFDDYIYYLYG